MSPALQIFSYVREVLRKSATHACECLHQPQHHRGVQAPQKPSAPPIPVKARTPEEAAGKAQQAYAAQRPKAPPMPVKARTQEEAAEKAQQAYAAKPKAEAKTGRNFFERLRPEKVCSEPDVDPTRGANTGSHACSPICAFVASFCCWQKHAV